MRLLAFWINTEEQAGRGTSWEASLFLDRVGWGLRRCRAVLNSGRRPGDREVLGMEVLLSRRAFLAPELCFHDKKGIGVRLKEITVLFSTHSRSSLRLSSRRRRFPCCKLAPWHRVLVLTVSKPGRGDKGGTATASCVRVRESALSFQRSVRGFFIIGPGLKPRLMRIPCFSLPSSVPYRAMFLVNHHSPIRKFEVPGPFCSSV